MKFIGVIIENNIKSPIAEFSVRSPRTYYPDHRDYSDQ